MFMRNMFGSRIFAAPRGPGTGKCNRCYRRVAISEERRLDLLSQAFLVCENCVRPDDVLEPEAVTFMDEAYAADTGG